MVNKFELYKNKLEEKRLKKSDKIQASGKIERKWRKTSTL